MSNTAEVTPYQSSASIEVISQLLAAFARTDAERATIARYKDLKRQERLAAVRINVSQAGPQNLLDAAQALGFAPIKPVSLQKCDLRKPVELQDQKGRRLAVQLTGNRLALISENGRAPINDVVRRLTLDNTRRHLEAFGGGHVTSRQLLNGEIELTATEVKAKPDGAAAITARVDKTGVAHLDISNVRGGRCEKVLADFAQSVGGNAKNKKLKAAYYDDPSAPGEPARVKLKG